MYLLKSVEGSEMVGEATSPAPFGPGFAKEEIAQADRMEVWCSSFGDPGSDFNEFRLLKDNSVLASRRIEGY